MQSQSEYAPRQSRRPSHATCNRCLRAPGLTVPAKPSRPHCPFRYAGNQIPMADRPQPDSDPQPESIHQTWKLTLAYDGTDFQGWQVQPGLRTIQGQLQAALGRVTGESPLPQGSGRTDAGVHALAQVASFTLRAPIPPGNLLRAVNRTLPPSIRISEAKTARSAFHARHSAVAKTYEYRVLRGTDSPPFLCP